MDSRIQIAKRRLSNFVLQPMPQTRIGAYCIFLSMAFEKHFEALEQGNFSFRTKLGKNDAFHEAATILNRVTESLGKKYGIGPRS